MAKEHTLTLFFRNHYLIKNLASEDTLGPCSVAFVVVVVVVVVAGY